MIFHPWEIFRYKLVIVPWYRHCLYSRCNRFQVLALLIFRRVIVFSGRPALLIHSLHVLLSSNWAFYLFRGGLFIRTHGKGNDLWSILFCFFFYCRWISFRMQGERGHDHIHGAKLSRRLLRIESCWFRREKVKMYWENAILKLAGATMRIGCRSYASMNKVY